MLWHRKQSVPPQPQTQPSKTNPLDYPDGVAVRTSEGVFYIVNSTTKGRKKHKLCSERAVDSWQFSILPGSMESVKNFKSGPPLGFRNGTLIENIADGKMYLISENKRRHILSPDVVDRFGFEWDSIYLVSQQEINLHTEGEVLN